MGQTYYYSNNYLENGSFEIPYVNHGTEQEPVLEVNPRYFLPNKENQVSYSIGELLFNGTNDPIDAFGWVAPNLWSLLTYAPSRESLGDEEYVGSPDYFHKYGTGYAKWQNIHPFFDCYRKPFDGDGYTGIVLIDNKKVYSPLYPCDIWTEYIQSKIPNVMEPGEYHVSFRISKAPVTPNNFFTNHSIGNFGAYFSRERLIQDSTDQSTTKGPNGWFNSRTHPNPSNPSNHLVIKTDRITSEPDVNGEGGWDIVEGNITIPQGGSGQYYITIGHFDLTDPDRIYAQVDPPATQNDFVAMYYFIDSVEVRRKNDCKYNIQILENPCYYDQNLHKIGTEYTVIITKEGACIDSDINKIRISQKGGEYGYDYFTGYPEIPDEVVLNNPNVTVVSEQGITTYTYKKVVFYDDDDLNKVIGFRAQVINYSNRSIDHYTIEKVYEPCDETNPTTNCCPWDIIESWLTVNSEKGGGDCDEDQCFFTHNLNVPNLYRNCYYQVNVTQSINGQNVNSESFTSINNIDMGQFDICVAPGQNYEIRINMYRQGFENPCEIYQSFYCPPCNCDLELAGQLLTLEGSPEGEGCDENECKVNVDFNFESDYLNNCFTSLLYSSKIDGMNVRSETPAELSEFIPSDLDRCISPGTEYSVTIKLLRDEGEPCEITKVYSCPCPCPVSQAEMMSWLKVTVTPGEPLAPCDEDHCQVSAILNIPNLSNCYTLFKIDDTGPLVGIPSDVLPLSQRNLFQGAYSSLGCIEKDQYVPITLYLYKGYGDNEPCIINNFAFCPNETEFEPCAPAPCNNPETKWEYKTRQFPYPDCDDCEYKVEFRHRTNICSDDSRTQDLQILKLELIGNGCSTCGISSQELQEESIKKLIFENPMNFYPRTSTDPCNDTWRVVIASCWAEYDRYDAYAIDEEGNFIHVKTFSPCNGSECCMVGMRVCRFINPEKITVQPLSSESGVSICSSLSLMVINPYTFGTPHQNIDPTTGSIYITHYTYMRVDCNDKCSDLFAIEDLDYRGKFAEFDYEFIINHTFDDIEVNSLYKNEILHSQVICHTDCSELTIGIFSIHGQLLIQQDYSVKKGVNNLILNLNELNTGMYLIRYSSGGSYQSADKLIIVK